MRVHERAQPQDRREEVARYLHPEVSTRRQLPGRRAFEIARRVVTLFRDVRPPEQSDCALTPHEKRILGMPVDGHNYKTAAAALGLSVNTIGFHAKSIYSPAPPRPCGPSASVATAPRPGLP